MRKITFSARLLLLSFMVFFGHLTQAQVANYTFSQVAGTYTPITGGTILGVPGNDDTGFGPVAIGFDFTYNGVVYNQVGINSNGFLALGVLPANSYASISTGTTNNVIAGFNYDTQGDATTGDLQYIVLGSAPNRVFVVQWTNYDSYQSVLNNDTWNYQIRLSETTNEISVVYGNMLSDATANTPQVGLRGNSSADFNIRTTTTDWSASTAGATNAATMTASNTVLPVSGLTYTWTPPLAPPAPANLTFTAVTTNSMILNWEDNSTNESGFYVYRSLDGITYSLVGTVLSTTSAAIGGAYTFNQVSLSSNTTYYYQVYSYNPTISLPLSGSQATLPGVLCGTSSIGPTGTYPSITAAVADAQTNGVSCPVIWELQAAYVSTVETFPIVVPALGLSATNNITLRPELGATNLSITSGAAQTIAFSGCNYFTIDGRPGGTGTTSQLTVADTVVTGMAVQYINDASFNALRYLSVKGVNNLATQGVITYGNSATNGLGSVGNLVSNCNVFDGSTTPNNLIYSANTVAGAFNSTTVENCNLYNFFNPASVSTAIRTDAGNTAWTIVNNNIYQTATRTYTTANIHDGIFINTASGRGYTITGNYIGGTAPLAAGSAMTMNGTIATRFFGISLNVASGGTTSVVSNNTIGNINLTTSSGSTVGVIVGVNTAGTGGNITINGNTVGTTSGIDNIVATSTTTGAALAGIANSASGIIAITNNNIGGFNIGGSTAAISTSCLGITSSGGNNTITGNLVGSTSVSNSFLTAPSTGSTAGLITGIQCSSTLTNTISNNVIQNLSNRYSGTSTSGIVRGLNITSGINTVNANSIRNLSNLTPQTGSGLTTSVIGLSISATTAGVQVVSNNVIENLVNNGTVGNISVAGMVVSTGTANAHQIFNNKISGIGAPLNLSAPVINGITVVGGTSTYYNNMIVLGLDALGTAYTAAQEYNGILKSGTSNNNFYFNSIHIAGIGVATGTANTFAFRRTATGVDIAQNNIFANTRSDAAAGTTTHNSYGLNAITTFTSDNNDIWGNGTGWQAGIVGPTAYGSLSLWKGGTNLDLLSTTVNPNFVSATDLHINNVILAAIESKGVVIPAISLDIDGQNRPGPTGSVNGGGLFPDLGADEFDGIPVSLDMGVASLASPLSSGCKTATETVSVNIQNFSNQLIDFALNPVTVTCVVTGPNTVSFNNVVINIGTLAAGAQQLVTFSTAYDMTAVGNYVFSASTVLAGDGAPSNDAIPNVTINNTPGTASGTTNAICAFSSTNVTVAGFTPGGTIQWQQSPNGISGWVDVPGATTAVSSVIPTDTTYYRAVVCGNPSNAIFINAPAINPPVAAPVTRCGPGPVTLTASSSNQMAWYANPTGGTALATGATYSPNVTANTTYYVGAQSGAQNTPVPGGNTWNQYTTVGSFQSTTISGASMVFDALQNVTVASVDIYPSAAIGTSFTIEVRQSSGTGALIASYTGVTTVQNTGVPSVAQTVPVNFSIPAGTNYVIGFASNPSTWRGNVTNFPYPYTLPGYFNIQGSSFGTSPGNTLIYQYYLYNFVISTGCESQRTAVPVTVTVPPSVSVASNLPAVCEGSSATLTATSSNAGYVYTWTPAASLSSSTGASVTATPTAATTYTVTANDAVSGCEVINTVSVGVNLLPVATATATPAAVCAGSTVNLVGSSSTDPSISYAWSPSAGLPNATSPTTSAVINAPQSYVYTVTNTTTGCSATDTVAVSVLPTTSSTTNITACGSYTLNGVTYTNSGTFSQLLTNANGCDSTATLVLTINQPSASSLAVTACDSYTWAQNGLTYTTSGNYSVVLPGANSIGCDSTITLNLTINNATSSTMNVAACDSFTWAQNGTTYTASGNYSVVLPGANSVGCDSTVNLVLTIGTPSSSSVSVTECGSYTWPLTGATYTTSGSYATVLAGANASGCDSTVTLNLTINSLPTATATDNGDATISASTGVSYQWINCATNASIAGETSQNFTVTANGGYAVIVTNANGCSDTSACVTIGYIGLDEITKDNIVVYPNPTQNEVTINMTASEASLELVDAQGKVLQKLAVVSGDKISLASYERGVYFLNMRTVNGLSTVRVVKQ